MAQLAQVLQSLNPNIQPQHVLGMQELEMRRQQQANVDPIAKAKQAFFLSLQGLMNDPNTPPEQKAAGQEMFMRMIGLEQKQQSNPNRESIALGAASGDPEQKAAWDLLSQDKSAQGFAPQVETRYLPIDGDLYEYSTVDRVGGTTKPVLRDGKPIRLTAKQLLAIEGKKTESLNDPFQNKLLGEFGANEGKRLSQLRENAQRAVTSERIINEGIGLLDKGVYTGSAANIRLGLNKWLQEGRVYVNSEKAANTEAYASLMGQQVAQIIKEFGAGTGLSDADREYAEKIAGGKITLTESSIRKLFDIHKRLSRATVNVYNTEAKNAKAALESREYFQPINMAPDSTLSGTDEMPPASQYQGKTIRNTMTGKRMKSDGANWVEVP